MFPKYLPQPHERPRPLRLTEEYYLAYYFYLGLETGDTVKKIHMYLEITEQQAVTGVLPQQTYAEIREDPNLIQVGQKIMNTTAGSIISVWKHNRTTGIANINKRYMGMLKNHELLVKIQTVSIANEMNRTYTHTEAGRTIKTLDIFESSLNPARWAFQALHTPGEKAALLAKIIVHIIE